jgi:hypothetical protein
MAALLIKKSDSAGCSKSIGFVQRILDIPCGRSLTYSAGFVKSLACSAKIFNRREECTKPMQSVHSFHEKAHEKSLLNGFQRAFFICN